MLSRGTCLIAGAVGPDETYAPKIEGKQTNANIHEHSFIRDAQISTTTRHVAQHRSSKCMPPAAAGCAVDFFGCSVTRTAIVALSSTFSLQPSPGPRHASSRRARRFPKPQGAPGSSSLPGPSSLAAWAAAAAQGRLRRGGAHEMSALLPRPAALESCCCCVWLPFEPLYSPLFFYEKFEFPRHGSQHRCSRYGVGGTITTAVPYGCGPSLPGLGFDRSRLRCNEDST